MLNFFNKENTEKAFSLSQEVGKMLNSLITKLEKLAITETKIKSIIKKINQKVKELQEETNTIKQINIIDEISTERNHYLTLYWASYIGYLKNITDEKYLKSEEIMAKYDGEYNNSIYKMYEVISSLANKDKLREKYGERFLAIANNQKILLSKNTELRQKELELRKNDVYSQIPEFKKIDDEIKPRKERLEESAQAVLPKIKKLASYYKPYLGLFLADMFFATLSAGIGPMPDIWMTLMPISLRNLNVASQSS